MHSHVIERQIAGELNARPEQVQAAVRLLDEGSTVPFIARYRKEVTGGLDDSQLRTLESRLGYLRELEDRRQVIIRSIEEQGKLTPELARELKGADSKTRLEDLHLPYKPKRRTKGQMAIEAGLEPLANLLLTDPMKDPEQAAARFLNAEQGITDSKAALDGARYILMERFAEQADLLEKLRDYLWQNATLRARVVAGKEQEGAKFKDYFEHDEPLHKAPPTGCWPCCAGATRGSSTSRWSQVTMRVPAPAKGSLPTTSGSICRTARRTSGCRGGELDLEDQAVAPDGDRTDRPHPRVGRGRGDQGVRHEPQGFADGGSGRHALHHGAGSR